jgi:hypothetical protein
MVACRLEENMSDGLAVVSSLNAPSYREGLLLILGDSKALKNKIKN